MKLIAFFTLVCSLSLPAQAADSGPAADGVTPLLELIQNHGSRPERLYLVLSLTCTLWTQLLSGPRFTLDIPDEMLAEDGTHEVELELSPEAAEMVIRFRALNAVWSIWDSIPRLAPLKLMLLQKFEESFNQPSIAEQIAKFQFLTHAGAVFLKPIQKISPARQTELSGVLQEVEQQLYEYIPSSSAF
jgi:hypothetical protein